MGQTMAVINYDYAVQLGLQEGINDVGAFGVQMNRAIGAADSIIYIPLIALSIIGLILKKQWALLTTAAVLGISAYWAITASFLLTLLAGVPGYYFEPGFDYWLIITIYITFGITGLLYLIFRGDRLLV